MQSVEWASVAKHPYEMSESTKLILIFIFQVVASYLNPQLCNKQPVA